MWTMAQDYRGKGCWRGSALLPPPHHLHPTAGPELLPVLGSDSLPPLPAGASGPPNPALPLSHTATSSIPHGQRLCSSLLPDREAAARERCSRKGSRDSDPGQTEASWATRRYRDIRDSCSQAQRLWYPLEQLHIQTHSAATVSVQHRPHADKGLGEDGVSPKLKKRTETSSFHHKKVLSALFPTQNPWLTLDLRYRVLSAKEAAGRSNSICTHNQS